MAADSLRSLRSRALAPHRPIWTIRRLLALFGAAAYLDFLFMTRSPRQMLGYALTDAILAVAGAAGTLLLAERFQGIGAWTREQVVFMLGYAVVATGVLNLLFGYNVLFISRRLGRGQLDHTLAQPQPLWMALLTEGFVPFSGLAEIVPGAALMVWAGGRLSLAPTPGWLALLALNLVASAVVVVSFCYLWGSLAFRAPVAAEEISSAAIRLLGQLKPFPLDSVGPLLAGGLLSVLPAGFVAWFPCRALLGLDGSAWSVFATPLAAAVFLALACATFSKGLQHYARTGSQRYTAFGHRR